MYTTAENHAEKADKETADYMKCERLSSAIDKLADTFNHINWRYIEAPLAAIWKNGTLAGRS